MKMYRLLMALSVVALLVFAVGCIGSDDSTSDSADSNQAPVANAGSDQTAEVGNTVTLNGNGSSDADAGDTLVYVWTISSAPDGSAATITNMGNVIASFTPDVAGTYVIMLTVTDGAETSSDTMTVTVQGAAGPEVLDSNINADTRLVNRIASPDLADYILDRTVDVYAELKIDPGVKIVTKADSRIDINVGGRIIAAGTADSMVVITGEVKTPGHWQGINISSNDPANSIEYTEISYGGGSGYANVNVNYEAQVSLINSTFTYSKTVGVVLENGSKLNIFQQNTFQNNTVAAMDIPLNLLGSLDTQSTFAGENGKDIIRVSAREVASDQTWPAVDVPYLLQGSPDISATVTIAAGAQFLMASGSRLDVYSGALIVAGTADNIVTFKGEVETPGYWSGINFTSNNPANSINYADIRHAGSNGYAGAYIQYESKANITNSTFAENATYGVHVESNGNLVTFSSNTFQSNTTAGILIPFDMMGMMDSASTYVGSNGKDVIEVTHGEITQPQTWHATDAPYFINSSSDVNAAVTIEPGTNFLMASESRLDVYEGSINATGTADAMITFKGYVETSGYWQGINVASNDPNNVFEYVEVAHAGNSYANIYVQYEAQATVQNCYIHDSGTYGIEVENGGNLTESGNTFANNAEGDIKLPE